MDDRQLGLAAAGDDRPSPDRRRLKRFAPGAALDHLAGELEPGDVLRRARRRRVVAAHAASCRRR